MRAGRSGVAAILLMCSVAGALLGFLTVGPLVLGRLSPAPGGAALSDFVQGVSVLLSGIAVGGVAATFVVQMGQFRTVRRKQFG